MALDRDFEVAAQRTAEKLEPSYRKRRRSDLLQLNVTVEPQSFVDAKAMARMDGKSVGEFVCELIKRETWRRMRKAA